MRIKDAIFNILKKELPDIQKNVPLKNYTTFKIGGPAKYFFVAKSIKDLIKAVKISKRLKLPVFVLAGGSNILVSDEGFNGLVVKVDNSQLIINNLNEIYAEAGVMLPKLVGFASKNSLAGLEWAAGIPGTVGGAVYGNAQAFGGRISGSVKKIEALDIRSLKVKNFTRAQCRFSLKNSAFKKNKNLIIISAVLKLNKGSKKEIKEKIRENIKYRKKNHPIAFPSAGSVFVNPESKKKILPAGYLIEKCRLSGKKIGKAQISKMHSNFIVNLGGARAKDVLKLINIARKEVKKSFGIKLEAEVQFVGF